jgi:hypothetical protein
VESPRDVPPPDAHPVGRTIRDLATAWHAAAHKALDIMSTGGDPSQAEWETRQPRENPPSVFRVLDGFTKLFCQSASDLELSLEPLKLLQFVELVELWCMGNQGAELYVRAKSYFRIADTEVNRVTKMSRKKAGPSKPVEGGPAWNVDGQIISTLKEVGHCLTTTQLLAEMQTQYPDDAISKSTVKKRLAVMVHEKRLTKNQTAAPRGYGLLDWDHVPGS